MDRKDSNGGRHNGLDREGGGGRDLQWVSGGALRLMDEVPNSLGIWRDKTQSDIET